MSRYTNHEHDGVHGGECLVCLVEDDAQALDLWEEWKRDEAERAAPESTTGPLAI